MEKLGVHETIELNELLMFKTICTAKSFVMSKLAQDEQLKILLNEDVKKSSMQMEQLISFLQPEANR